MRVGRLPATYKQVAASVSRLSNRSGNVPSVPKTLRRRSPARVPNVNRFQGFTLEPIRTVVGKPAISQTSNHRIKSLSSKWPSKRARPNATSTVRLLVIATLVIARTWNLNTRYGIHMIIDLKTPTIVPSTANHTEIISTSAVSVGFEKQYATKYT